MAAVCEPKKIGAYLRTSTGTQDITSQREMVEEWAARTGHEVVYFEDQAQTGKKSSRQAISSLLGAAGRGELQMVALTELSRIGRSMGFIAQTVERLSGLGVKLVLVSTGTVVDYTTLEGRALVNALALAADIEWCLIQERNARGRATIAARGIKVGAKRKDVSLAAIKALRDLGNSIRDIARELGVSPATICRRLRDLDAEA